MFFLKLVLSNPDESGVYEIIRRNSHFIKLRIDSSQEINLFKKYENFNLIEYEDEISEFNTLLRKRHDTESLKKMINKFLAHLFSQGSVLCSGDVIQVLKKANSLDEDNVTVSKILLAFDIFLSDKKKIGNDHLNKKKEEEKKKTEDLEVIVKEVQRGY